LVGFLVTNSYIKEQYDYGLSVVSNRSCE